MYVAVDLASGNVQLHDADNFKAFHVVPVGEGYADDVAKALGSHGRPAAKAGEVKIDAGFVRQLARRDDDTEWQAGFDKMLGFAAKMGWVEGSFVQAHIEWPKVSADTLWQSVEDRAALTPNLTMALDETGRVVSFKEFRDHAERVAAALHELGVRSGDVVTWQLPTWIDAMVLTAALARVDAVQNPIISIYREREVGFCARQAGATLLIVPGVWRGFDFTAMAQSIAAANDKIEVLTIARGELPEGDPAVLPPPPAVVDAAAAPVRWLMYTSGTTSDPKGARHVDHTHAIVARATAARLDVQHGDRPSLTFPYPHIGGIMWLFVSLQTGCTLLFDESFDAQRTPTFLSQNGCTHPGSGTPFHLVYLNVQRERPDTPLFPLAKVFPGGGSPKPPEIFYEVKRELGGAGVVSGWGLTETPILSMGTYKDPDDKLAQTEGKAMPGCEIIVVKADGSRGAPREEGELRAKAPQMMRGYLDSSLDADAFDSEGYFRTGDLGYLDEDGYVVITGRLKDVIIRNAENISAKEVEDLLYLHPAVGDVAVIGIPDKKTGERVVAVVATADGAGPLAFVDMQNFLKQRGLRMQAIPEQLEHVDAIPRNPSGKIQKNVLRERFGNSND